MAGPHIYASKITLNSVQLLSGSGNPNGLISAPLGSLWIRDDAAEIYQNTDGATAWVSATITNISVLFDFTFATPSPAAIAPLPAGSVVESAQIIITTVFDDVAATLELGTPAFAGDMMMAADNDPAVAAVYAVESPLRNALATTFRLTLTPGASTQGVGYVLANIRL